MEDCMKRLVEFPIQDGEVILVEVDDVEYSDSTTRRGLSPSGVTERAKVSFEEALDQAQPVAAVLMDKLRSLGPDEATIEFGMKLSADVGAILASASSEAHYKVTLKWQKAS
jgi:hypothetical protein